MPVLSCMLSFLSSRFLIDFENLARGTLPAEARSLLFAAGDQALPQCTIHQHVANPARDVEHVFGIHQHGGIAYRLRQRADVRSHHRRSRRHGLEWRQSKTFVERWKYEGSRTLVENTQRIKWDEAQKARTVLHAAVNHGSPDGRVAGNLIADDDQPQVGIKRMAGELVAHDGEGFDQTRNIFLRANISGIEQEWVLDLISLHDAAPLALLGLGSGGA